MNNELIEKLIPILKQACLDDPTIIISVEGKDKIQITANGLVGQHIFNISDIVKENNLLFFIIGRKYNLDLIIFQP